jgi:FtsZ-binding cell division protein ZapB
VAWGLEEKYWLGGQGTQTQLCFARQPKGDGGAEATSKEVSSSSAARAQGDGRSSRFGGVVDAPFLETLRGVFELGDESEQEAAVPTHRALQEVIRKAMEVDELTKKRNSRMRKTARGSGRRRLEERRRGRKNENHCWRGFHRKLFSPEACGERKLLVKEACGERNRSLR